MATENFLLKFLADITAVDRAMSSLESRSKRAGAPTPPPPNFPTLPSAVPTQPGQVGRLYGQYQQLGQIAVNQGLVTSTQREMRAALRKVFTNIVPDFQSILQSTEFKSGQGKGQHQTRTAFLGAQGSDADKFTAAARAVGVAEASVLRAVEQQVVTETKRASTSRKNLTLEERLERVRERELRKAEIAQASARDPDIILSQAQSRLANAQRTQAIAGLTAPEDQARRDRQAEASRAERDRQSILNAQAAETRKLAALNDPTVSGTKQSAAVRRAKLSAEATSAVLADETVVLQRLENASRRGELSALESQRRREARSAALGGAGGVPGGPGGPSGGFFRGQTPGAFFGQGLRSTVRYGLPGLLLYSGLDIVRDMVREATELQVELGILESQFNSVVDAAGQFQGMTFDDVRQSVLDIARDTATAADQVAKVQRQLAGAFSDPNTLAPNFARAQVETETALKFSRVSGLPVQEITDSLTALALAFDTNFEDIADNVIGLETRFGVLSTELIRFAADLAPVGAELGFTSDELLTLGAAAQQATGQAGGSLAEQFRRILPAIQDQRAELVALYHTYGLSDTAVENLTRSFAENDIQEVLTNVLQVYRDLSEEQKRLFSTDVADLLGGRREAGALLAVFERAPGILAALEQGTEGFGGGLEGRFDNVRETVQFAFDEMRRAIEQLGITLFDAGLADVLRDIASAAKLLTQVLGLFVGVLSDLNDLAGGLPVRLIALALAIKAIGGLGGNIRGRLGPNPDTGLGGLGGLYLAPQVQGTVTQRAAAAIRRPVTSTRAAVNSSGLVASLAPALALMGVTALQATVQEIQDSIDLQNEELGVRVLAELEKGTSIEEILSRVDTGAGSSIGTRVTNVFTRGSHRSTGELVAEQISRTIIESYKPYTDALLASGDVTQGGKDLLNDAIEEGNAVAVRDFIERMRQSALTTPSTDFAQTFTDLDAAKELALAAEEAATRSLAAAESLEDIRSRYEAGELPLQDYLDGVNRQISAWQGMLEIDKKDAATRDLIVQARQDLTDRVTQAAQSQLNIANRVQEIVGTGNTASTSLESARTAYLQIANTQNITAEARLDALLSLAEAERAVYEERIANAVTAAEKLAIMEQGFTLSVEAAKGLLLAQLQFGSDAPAVSAIANILQTSVESVSNRIVELAEETGKDFEIIADILIQARINALRKILDVILDISQTLGTQLPGASAIKLAIRALNDFRDRDVISTPTTTGGSSPQELVDARNEAAEEALKIAEERNRAAQDLAEAELDLALAFAERDPVKAAKIAQQKASVAYDYAQTTAERLQALAAGVRANRQLADAIFGIQESQIDLAIAFADAAGDSVEAARLGLQKAQEALNYLTGAGAGEAELNAARGAVRQQEAGYRDAQLSDRREYYQYLYDMGQINKQQLISYLQSLLQIPELTQDQIRDINLEIHRLREQLGQDFQFNLPTQLGLPTLYEVNRFGQGAAPYTDARQISVTVWAQSNATPEDIAAAVVDVVGDPSRTGTYARRY